MSESGDPWGMVMEPAEWAIFGLGVAVYLVDLIAVGIIIYYRNYPPLKVKQVDLVVVSILSGMIWMFGTFAAVRLLPQANHPVFLHCDLWAIWLQQVFGVILWVCVVIFRFWRLYTIVNHLKFNASSWKFRLTFLFFWAPGLIWGIVGTAVRVNGPFIVDGVFRCDFLEWAKYVSLVIIGIYTLILAYFAISLRSIKQRYLNEYKETRNTLLVFVILYIVYIALQVVSANRHLWGRIISGIIGFLPPNLTFWVTVGVPLYHCLFNHADYERRFKDEVKVMSGSTHKQQPRTHSKAANVTAPESTTATNTSKEQEEDMKKSVSQVEMAAIEQSG